MKKIYILLTLFFASTAAFAQVPGYVGDVIIDCSKMTVENGMLHMEFDIDIDAKAMNHRQSWAITPELVSDDKTMVKEFPYILINGKTKRQLYERKLKFENTELLANPPYMVINVDRKTKTNVQYVLNTPYEEWMATSDLVIRQVLTSCAEQKQLFVINLDKYMLREVIEPYSATPHVSFIIPENEMISESALIHYHLDRTDIDKSYMDNPAEFEKIRRMTEELKRSGDDNAELRIEGYASPEGPYQRNVYLAEERAKRLKEYVHNTFGVPESQISTGSVPEDWKWFREFVLDSNVSHKNEILAIVDSNDTPAQKEQRIKALAGGEPYRNLLSGILPRLRRAEYRINYSLNDYTDADFNKLMSKRPQDLTQTEIYLLAQHYPVDSPHFDVLFNEMVTRYSDSPSANNNAAAYMLMRGEPYAAKAYLDKAEDNATKWNNYGIYYMQLGDLAQAERMFRRAAENGIPEAYHNLAEVQKLADYTGDLASY